MGELRRAGTGGGLYERLLQRLALALEEADSLGGLAAESPQELELRDLTSAEMELIRAYLNRDLDWLRGWHAAAQEMAQIEQMQVRRKVGRSVHKVVTPLPSPKPLLRRQPRLCCALCGTLAGNHLGQGVQVCRTCGSQLFRASNPR
jgi:hypothetical protein